MKRKLILLTLITILTLSLHLGCARKTSRKPQHLDPAVVAVATAPLPNLDPTIARDIVQQGPPPLYFEKPSPESTPDEPAARAPLPPQPPRQTPPPSPQPRRPRPAPQNTQPQPAPAPRFAPDPNR